MPTTTNYIWDEHNYLAESDATNAINVVYTNEPQQYGNLISSRISGTTSYHHFDAIGSTRQLTNAAGTVTDTMIYDVWGNVANRTGTTAVVFLWIGQVTYYLDKDLSSLYIRARSYSAVIARWTSYDPLDFVNALNLFTYVANQALLLQDPTGRAYYSVDVAFDAYNGNLMFAAVPGGSAMYAWYWRISHAYRHEDDGTTVEVPTTTVSVFQNINFYKVGYYNRRKQWEKQTSSQSFIIPGLFAGPDAFTELFAADTTDIQAQSFGNLLGCNDSGILIQYCRASVNEFSRTKNPAPPAGGTLVRQGEIYWDKQFYVGLGYWSHDDGFPKTVPWPESVPAGAKIAAPGTSEFSLSGYSEVISHRTELQYSFDSTGTKSTCHIIWNFTFVSNGKTTRSLRKDEVVSPCGGDTIKLG
jgi:RHS repeat-associated protein